MNANKDVDVQLTDQQAVIGNRFLSIRFDLETGTYSGIDRSSSRTVFRDAWFRIGEGGWREQALSCKAELLENLQDAFGEGKTLRVSYRTEARYDPDRFLDITLYICGWMTSDDVLGDNVPINNSPALVEQMAIARDTGLTRYTDIAVRLEPDYYCYQNEGDTQQGWYDDKHWARYGTLREPYETFGKFCSTIAERGGYTPNSVTSDGGSVAWESESGQIVIHASSEDNRRSRITMAFDQENGLAASEPE